MHQNVVGSGINGLVASAELARAGWSVILLERNAEIGGFIATEERRQPPPARLWVNHIDWRFRGSLCQANGPFQISASRAAKFSSRYSANGRLALSCLQLSNASRRAPMEIMATRRRVFRRSS